jgi:CheY-like chemotaxis protein
VLLEKAGHNVTLAENGHEAVDAVRRADFDVVLMDIQMPELDGVGATREIRALPVPKSAVPIIAMTANAMTGAKAQYLAAGMNDYIPKPIQSGLLFAKLAHIADSLAEWNASESEAPVDPATTPLLNAEKLSDLETVLPSKVVREFLSLYVTDMDVRVTHIENATAQGDLMSVSRDAHVIVSTSGNIGASRVCLLARQLEHACCNMDKPSAKRLTREFIAASRATSDAIRRKLDESAGDFAQIRTRA